MAKVKDDPASRPDADPQIIAARRHHYDMQASFDQGSRPATGFSRSRCRVN
jgi:hypothetical protein